MTVASGIFLRCETCGERPAVIALALTKEGESKPWGDHLFCQQCYDAWEKTTQRQSQ